MPRKIAAGNWKMNGTEAALKELLAISIVADDLDCTAILCPPATLLQQAAQSTRSVAIGGQNCHHGAIFQHRQLQQSFPSLIEVTLKCIY